MSGRPFLTTERVRWADVDLVGIMRFSAVPRFIELAEQELLRDAGVPYSGIFVAPEVWMPRRHMAIDYLAPARIDDELTLVTWVSRLGDTSYTMRVDLQQADGRVVAATTLVIVCVTVADFAKRALPDEWRAALARYLWSPVKDAATGVAGDQTR
jgi:YbgC/YbaW family acyl-CoA thioester hydrolase